MKHIESLKMWEIGQKLTSNQFDFLNESCDSWEIDRKTGLVYVFGNFDCSGKLIANFGSLEFGEIDGDFYCYENLLTSLEGSPNKVRHDFICASNKLTSLKGAPQEVGDNFHCQDNKITSLEGAPNRIPKSFHCERNELTSLKGSPNEVGVNFDCSQNFLTSLEGSPEVVKEDFYCGNNYLLSSLKGGPKKVGKVFYCFENSLTTLEGAPENVEGLYCSDNRLESLKGAPKEVKRDFECLRNPLTSLEGAPQEIGGYFMCDEFSLSMGEWNPQGWLKILKGGSKEAKKLILTLPFFKPEYLQSEIDKNHGKWVMYLKDIWNSEEFRPLRDQLKLSGQFLKDIGDQSDLSDLGF